jgi:NADH:ubiquinone oxidoreductase subunit 6 (subunit J)
MTKISAHMIAMVDVGTSTLLLFGLICGGAVWLMRNHLANILTVILIFPLVLGLSLIVNHILMTLGIFDPKKMADWMIGTITAATAGVMFGLGIMAVCARMWERQPA